MNLYDCLYPAGRTWTPATPYPGMLSVLVDGQRFYAIKPNTGGARDTTRYDGAEAAKWPKLAPDARCVADIEDFEVVTSTGWNTRPAASTIRLYPGAEVDRDAGYMIQTCNDTRSGSAGAPVGVYGMLPVGFDVYNAVIVGDKTKIAKIEADNDYIAATGLLAAVDALHPVLYCISSDQPAWVKFAKFQFAQCRRIMRKFKRPLPIVPFICPTYHPSADGGRLGFKPIGIPYWRFILKTLKAAKIDGPVLWQGHDEINTWSTIEPYTQEAIKFK